MDVIQVDHITARVKETFKLSGRGHVFVLASQDGPIPINGRVWNGFEFVGYQGPDFVRTVAGPELLAVTIATQDLRMLSAAQSIEFKAAIAEQAQLKNHVACQMAPGEGSELILDQASRDA